MACKFSSDKIIKFEQVFILGHAGHFCLRRTSFVYKLNNFCFAILPDLSWHVGKTYIVGGWFNRGPGGWRGNRRSGDISFQKKSHNLSLKDQTVGALFNRGPGGWKKGKEDQDRDFSFQKKSHNLSDLVSLKDQTVGLLLEKRPLKLKKTKNKSTLQCIAVHEAFPCCSSILKLINIVLWVGLGSVLLNFWVPTFSHCADLLKGKIERNFLMFSSK